MERLAAGTACSALHFACARHDGGDDDDDDGDGGDDDGDRGDDDEQEDVDDRGLFADRMHIT